MIRDTRKNVAAAKIFKVPSVAPTTRRRQQREYVQTVLSHNYDFRRLPEAQPREEVDTYNLPADGCSVVASVS